MRQSIGRARSARNESVSRPSSSRSAKPQAKSAGVADTATSAATQPRVVHPPVAQGVAANRKQATNASMNARATPMRNVADDAEAPVVGRHRSCRV